MRSRPDGCPLDISRAITATILVIALAILRFAVGLSPFVAPRFAMRLLGLPLEHDTPTLRVVGRFAGVRDVGLGLLALFALSWHPAWLGFVCLFNACHDLIDAGTLAVPLLHDSGIDRAAASGIAGALGFVGLWSLAWWFV